MTTSANMTFKEAWRAVGNPSPGNTSWSADVNGRPVFTAWALRDLKYDKANRRSTFFSPPGDWVLRGEGQSYLRRARQAFENNWVCRLILLDGVEPWEKVRFAYIDERHYGVRFNQVEDDGTISGDLVAMSDF
jgi:hypothetical protein